ncbi:MAG: hypothetical protein ACTSU6_06575 [Candidatus Njordarchaeales archaeon]
MISNNKISRFSMVTEHGLLFYLEPLIFSKRGGVYIERTIQILNRLLKIAKDIYAHFQMFGDLLIRVEYTETPEKPLDLFDGNLHQEYRPLDKPIVIERKVSFTDLDDRRILYFFFNQLLRSYGCSLTDDMIHRRIEKYANLLLG